MDLIMIVNISDILARAYSIAINHALLEVNNIP